MIVYPVPYKQIWDTHQQMYDDNRDDADTSEDDDNDDQIYSELVSDIDGIMI